MEKAGEAGQGLLEEVGAVGEITGVGPAEDARPTQDTGTLSSQVWVAGTTPGDCWGLQAGPIESKRVRWLGGMVARRTAFGPSTGWQGLVLENSVFGLHYLAGVRVGVGEIPAEPWDRAGCCPFFGGTRLGSL